MIFISESEVVYCIRLKSINMHTILLEAFSNIAQIPQYSEVQPIQHRDMEGVGGGGLNMAYNQQAHFLYITSRSTYWQLEIKRTNPSTALRGAQAGN